MKKTCKKIISAISAGMLCALPLIQSTQAGAYSSGQQHTWRFVEKTSAFNMEWYTSSAIQPGSYTFGSSERGNLIINSSNFQSTYYSSRKTLINSYSDNPPAINGDGYLSKSTWYTPVTVTSFSLNYSYTTSNDDVITPMYVLVGDFNNDKLVNSQDSKLISKYLANLSVNPNTSISERQAIAADVDNNGKITALDCALIEQFDLGEISHF